MNARKHRRAALEYTLLDRKDRPPRIGDTMQLGRQSYEVASLRVCVELRPVSVVDEDHEDE